MFWLSNVIENEVAIFYYLKSVQTIFEEKRYIRTTQRNSKIYFVLIFEMVKYENMWWIALAVFCASSGKFV